MTSAPRLNVLSLFAGIGGIELGLERAGMTTVGQVERDPYCLSVLAHHWPKVPQHDDVRTAPDWWTAEARPQVDVICGGFPCQPFSEAGSRLGIADERWGWPWFADVIRAVRPRYVLVENVAALLRHSDAFGAVLGDLAAFGFDAQWSVLSACSLGAPHTRERLFLVAHPPSDGVLQRRGFKLSEDRDPERDLHNWEAVPEPHRVADGIPHRVDRNRALGNAVVPDVAEHIGRLIVDDSAARTEGAAA